MKMKVSKVFGERPLPSEYCQILGEIVVEWTWLEYRVQEAIWHLLPIYRKDARTMTARIDMRGLVNVLRQLAVRHIKETDAKKTDASRIVRSIAGKIEAHIEERNRLIHGIWDYDPNKKIALVREYRQDGAIGKPTDYSINGLKQVHQCLRDWRQAIRHQMDRL